MNQWPVSTPPSLEDICIRTCLNHPHTICDVREDCDDSDGKTKIFVRHPDIHLPLTICEKLVSMYAEEHSIDDGFLHFFSGSEGTALTSLCLRGAEVSPLGLGHLSKHNILALDLSLCPEIAGDCIPLINSCFPNLRVLRFEGCRTLLSGILIDKEQPENFNSNACVGREARLFGREYILDLPQLWHLTLRDVMVDRHLENDLLSPLLLGLPSLTHLDLSGCHVDLHNLDAFDDLSSLVSLSLADIEISDIHFPILVQHIGKLRNLRHLDLSQSEVDVFPVMYSKPEMRLKQLVDSLPKLVSLDLSGTNLAGLEVEESTSAQPLPASAWAQRAEIQPPCSIPGLEGRRLQFLGLLGCAHSASSRANIPAEKYTGEDTEELVLYSCEVYRDKSGLLIRAFNSLFNLFRHISVQYQYRALKALLAGMRQHPKDKHVCISGSASLFYIAKGEHRNKLSWNLKRQMIETLLSGMETFYCEQTMMRNACLTLCHFNIPVEVLYCYQRLVSVLLKMLEQDHPDEFIQRIGIYLINCLACQVDGKEKEFVGEHGAIEIMLGIIRKKLAADTCDEAMEVAWSTMWNVTDETPSNCRKFLDSNGMSTFLECLQKFQCKPELLRNMMGLMGNIAEVQELRSVLMEEDYVTVFSDLLDSTRDGIEVSYNAAGVISHLAFDGPESWTIESPTRQSVLDRMRVAIERWDLQAQRNINYRSFEPILRLVADKRTPEVQLWGVWALCNLTGVYAQKYCHLLEREGGLGLLEDIVADPGTSATVLNLARTILSQVERFLAEPKPVEDVEMISEQHASDSESDGGD